MHVSKSIALVALLLLAVGTASAQRGRRDRAMPPPPAPPAQQGPTQQGPAQQGPGWQRNQPGAQVPPQGYIMHGPGPHFGDWLRKHQNMSGPDRLGALEKDPDFRRLPPQVQQRIRERLQDFDTRSPEEQQRILQRMETFEHLTPEQQQKVRGMFRDFRNLPPERRHALVQAFRQLQDLPADQREKAFDSDAFRSNFSEQERDLLRGMSALGFGPGARRPGPPPGPPPPAPPH